MRKGLVFVWLTVLFAGVAFIFWRSELKYHLPTPVPVNYHDVGRGATVALPPSAAACGVYSTPQAVLISTDGRLYFRGNYNRSRYCTDEKTGFARQALEGLLHGNYTLTFSPLALKAYGCTLPTCNQ